MEKFIEGQRVRNEFLGEGVIIKKIKGIHEDVFAYSVKFDNTPPKDYNNSHNPCMIFPAHLESI